MKTKHSQIIIVALALAASLIHHSAPGQTVTWVARGPGAYWNSVASSADGTKLAATCTNGLYTSPDSGVTWTARDTARYWAGVASSADGVRLVAGSHNEYGPYADGYVYNSTNSGVAWTRQSQTGVWSQFASSADGTRLAAIDQQADFGYQMFTSTTAGVTWINDISWVNGLVFSDVASAADGIHMGTCVYGGCIYITSDGGANWFKHGPTNLWSGIAGSSDGTKWVASIYGGQLYTSSDSGSTWTPRESSRNWNCVASSSTGTRLVAAVNGGQIYTSSDSGVTWTPSENNRAWQSVASCADGTKLVAAVYGGQIYTGTIPYPPENDQCSGAIALANGATYSMPTTNATSTGDPAPSCGYNVGKGVWFTYTPVTSRVVEVDTCGSDFDTVVQVYTGSCGALSQVAGGCDDDSNICGNGRQSSVAFAATAGTTYYILAGGYNGASGNLSITANEESIAVTQQPVSGTANSGDSYTFNVTATGANLSYQWQWGGVDYYQATNSSLAVSELDPTLAGNYRVVITNVYGAVTSSVATLSVDPALALALDTTGLTWTTGGDNGAWYRETLFSHDGVDAARCIGFSSSPPWLQTTVTGPGTLSFYWGFAIGLFDSTSDYLGLQVDGVEVAKCNASHSLFTVYFYPQTIYLAPGSHTLKWVYDRNGGTTGAAYLDQVSYISGATAAFIATQPTNQTAVAGSNATFTVVAAGTPPCTYQWQFNGVSIINATNSALTLANVQPIQGSNYSVVVANGYGSPMTSSNAYLTVTTIPLPVAVNYAGPAWTVSGNGQWFGQVSVTHDGVAAVQSGWMTNSQQCYLDTTLVGPGTLKFWWKVSSETNYDFLHFYANGVEKTSICGEVDWQQQTYAVPAGKQTLRWAYTKDVSLSRGSDAAWLDQVSYDGPPWLSISPLPPQQVLLFWPTSATSFTLQSTTNLVSTNSWQSVSNAPAVLNDNWAVTNATGLRQFYRLKK